MTDNHTPNHVVVYRASPGAATEEAMRRLFGAGLSPVELDHPDATLLYAARSSYTIRIAVPPEEVERAREVLEAYEDENRAEVEAIAGSLGKQVGHSLLVALGIAAALIVLGVDIAHAIALLFMIWPISFISMGLIDRAVRRP